MIGVPRLTALALTFCFITTAAGAQTATGAIEGRVLDSATGDPLPGATVVLGGADGTDGLEVTSASLGPEFPDGLMVAMNSAGQNLLLFRWRDIAAAAGPALKLRQPASTVP